MNFFKECSGDGSCLKPCPCKCSNECKCEHKDHNGYCPNYCCELVTCRNFDYCNQVLNLTQTKRLNRIQTFNESVSIDIENSCSSISKENLCSVAEKFN